MPDSPLLAIKNLQTFFDSEEGIVRAVRGVNLVIQKGEMLAVVGESGCGKSVTALSALRLIPVPPGRFESGEIFFEGRDLLSVSEKEMRRIRGNDISMIFQEPMTSLNPILSIGDQITESILIHQNKTKREAHQIAIEALKAVSIPSPEQRMDQYPHELSGGMKQRVMIAMALSCEPALLIADEPTTALDVTIQAQILELLNSLRETTQTAILLITHNLGIVAEYADRVAVMYSGKVVEEADVETLFDHPSHPYTQGLLNSLPQDDSNAQLQPVAGTVPNPAYLPTGCAFHPRCGEALPVCKNEIPPDFDLGRKHIVACWLFDKNPESRITNE